MKDTATAMLCVGEQTVRAPVGVTLLSVLRDQAPGAAQALDTPCGGDGRCGKCRVMARGALSAPDAAEKRVLAPAALTDGWRLACRARILGDATVTLPIAAARQIRTDGYMPAFTPSPMYARYGVAVDIGTTTLAAQLCGEGACLAAASALNPQAGFGADVISRIGYALSGPAQAAALAASVREGIAGLCRQLCAEAAVPATAVDALVLTGNTAMLYLLTGRDPACLSAAPFTAEHLFDETLPAEALQLPFPGARVVLPPCISGFVGADIVTALLASDICARPETALLVDIGTNGEIALWHDGRLLCCSTAAGPAFEGAGIEMGMGGKAGAVDHVTVNGGALVAHTVGGGAPVGICGSGLVDALACLLETGQLSETGLLAGGRAVIAPPVALTQRDVRMAQLAKSAVCAGIETAVARRGLSYADVQSFCVAGGFGSYVHMENAGRIGLIPRALVPVTRVLGNAALSGAVMLLQNTAFLGDVRHIAAAAETLELSTSPAFAAAYVDGMLFPEA